MSPTPQHAGGGAVRLVSGKAHVTETDGAEGRTLFPSLEFSHWPPFETLVESTMVGRGDPDPHPHADQEVVTYVLSGSLLVYDGERHGTEVPSGSVCLLSTVQTQVHDVNPKPRTTAHWLSLVLHVPQGTREPKRPYQIAPATPLAGAAPGVVESVLVGPPGPIHSVLALEMRDVAFDRTGGVTLPVGEDRTAAVYVLEGAARAAGRDLPAGSGLLADGVSELAVAGERGSRLMYASVMRGR